MQINQKRLYLKFLLSVLMISFTLGYTVFSHEQFAENRRVHSQAIGEIQQFVIQVEAEFADKLLAMQRMAQRHSVAPYTNESWRHDAQQYINDWKSWRFITWITHDTNTVLSEPQDHFDQFEMLQADLLKYIQKIQKNQTQQIVILHVNSDDLVSIIMCNQYLNKSCDYFIATFSLNKMIVDLLERNHFLGSYVIDVEFDNKLITSISPENNMLTGELIEQDFSFNNLQLLLHARPTLDYFESKKTMLPVVGGIFIAIVLICVMFSVLLIYALMSKSAKLLESEENYRKIHLRYKNFLEMAGEAVFGVDRNGVITYANLVASRMADKSQSDLHGSLLNDLFSDYADFFLLSSLIASTNSLSKRDVVKITRENNEALYFEYTATCFEEADDGTSCLIIMEDVTSSEKMKKDLIELTNKDSLTGLYNRRQFYATVSHELQERRNALNGMTLMYIDVDRFKSINDTYGHETGDFILNNFSQILSHCVRDEDVAARLSGDEFAVLLKNYSIDEVKKVAQKILEKSRMPVEIDHISLKLTVSIGIAVALDGEADVNELLLRADVALYRAKHNGKNTYQFFDEEIAAWLKCKTNLEIAIVYAVDNDKLSLFYQLRYCLLTQRVCGAEALVRFLIELNDTQNNKQVDTEYCIEIAEGIGIIESIGHYVIHQVFSDIRYLVNKNLLSKNDRISINVSSKQLSNPSFEKYFIDLVNEFNISPKNIEIEVTESCFIRKKSIQVELLRRLQYYGFAIAIDDFGSGYSSFGYLQNLPIDVVKIDKCFIDEIDVDDKNRIIVKAIIDLAHGLGFQVVAEGVENQQQAEIVASLGFDQLQGFLLSKPEPADYTLSHWEVYTQKEWFK